MRLQWALTAYHVAGDSETHTRGIADFPQARCFARSFRSILEVTGNRLEMMRLLMKRVLCWAAIYFVPSIST